MNLQERRRLYASIDTDSLMRQRIQRRKRLLYPPDQEDDGLTLAERIMTERKARSEGTQSAEEQRNQVIVVERRLSEDSGRGGSASRRSSLASRSSELEAIMRVEEQGWREPSPRPTLQSHTLSQAEMKVDNQSHSLIYQDKNHQGERMLEDRNSKVRQYEYVEMRTLHERPVPVKQGRKEETVITTKEKKRRDGPPDVSPGIMVEQEQEIKNNKLHIRAEATETKQVDGRAKEDDRMVVVSNRIVVNPEERSLTPVESTALIMVDKSETKEKKKKGKSKREKKKEEKVSMVDIKGTTVVVQSQMNMDDTTVSEWNDKEVVVGKTKEDGSKREDYTRKESEVSETVVDLDQNTETNEKAPLVHVDKEISKSERKKSKRAKKEKKRQKELESEERLHVEENIALSIAVGATSHGDVTRGTIEQHEEETTESDRKTKAKKKRKEQKKSEEETVENVNLDADIAVEAVGAAASQAVVTEDKLMTGSAAKEKKSKDKKSKSAKKRKSISLNKVESETSLIMSANMDIEEEEKQANDVKEEAKEKENPETNKEKEIKQKKQRGTSNKIEAQEEKERERPNSRKEGRSQPKSRATSATLKESLTVEAAMDFPRNETPALHNDPNIEEIAAPTPVPPPRALSRQGPISEAQGKNKPATPESDKPAAEKWARKAPRAPPSTKTSGDTQREAQIQTLEKRLDKNLTKLLGGDNGVNDSDDDDEEINNLLHGDVAKEIDEFLRI